MCIGPYVDFQTTVTFVGASRFRSQDCHCYTGRLTQKVLGTGYNIHDPIAWNRNRNRNISLIISCEEFEWRNPTSFKSPFFFTGIMMNKCIFKHGGF